MPTLFRPGPAGETDQRAARFWSVVVLFLALGVVAVAAAMEGGRSSPLLLCLPAIVVYAALRLRVREASPVAALAAIIGSWPDIHHLTQHSVAELAVATVSSAALILLLYRARMSYSIDEDGRRRAQSLATLQRVSAIVAGQLRMEDALQAIVAELNSAFGHELISVYLIERNDLALQAQAGYTSPYERIPLGTGVCGLCAATGRTIFIPDVASDMAYRPAVDGVVSEICVPLVSEGKVAGILNVESRRRLTELDRELLEFFGDQVAVVLRNARRTDELAQLAEREPVTGLLNHRAIMQSLDSLLKQPEPHCAALMIDLDCFKEVNDAHGHLAGDAVLRHVAECLRNCCREHDLAGRFGGDEFVVLLPEGGPALAGAVAGRIRTVLHARPYDDGQGTRIPLRASLGWAAAPEGGRTAQSLLAAADAAMYAEKHVSPLVGRVRSL